MGRSVIHHCTDELAAEICRRLSEGESLNKICEEDGKPSRGTVMAWVRDDVNGFAAKYARARELQAHFLAQEIIDIANTPEPGVTVTVKADGGMEEKRGDMIDHRKLKIDARKWYLSKVLPKVYGDKQQIEHSGTVSIADALRAAREKRETE